MYLLVLWAINILRDRCGSTQPTLQAGSSIQVKRTFTVGDLLSPIIHIILTSDTHSSSTGADSELDTPINFDDHEGIYFHTQIGASLGHCPATVGKD